ncbi:MAG: glycoside hydrolase family 127 protein [Verrucomicrobia bacterium]|nr:glycoside hydrolase family 127 protein [Verrucomicrobiota bacterium]
MFCITIWRLERGWAGTVRIELNPEKPVKFALRMRIPGWAEGRPLPSDLYFYLNRGDIKVELKVNGELTDAPRAKGYVNPRTMTKRSQSLCMVPLTTPAIAACVASVLSQK